MEVSFPTIGKATYVVTALNRLQNESKAKKKTLKL